MSVTHPFRVRAEVAGLIVLATLLPSAAEAYEDVPGTYRDVPVADMRRCEKPELPANFDAVASKDRRVNLVVQVDAGGAVKSVQVSDEPPHQELAARAVQAAERCQFFPALKNGRGVDGTARVAYDWNKYTGGLIEEGAAPLGRANLTSYPAILDFRRACSSPPSYPSAAIRDRYQGTLHANIHVRADGRVDVAVVTKRSGHAMLDNAFKRDVVTCTFLPGTVDGVAADMWAPIQYAYTLE